MLWDSLPQGLFPGGAPFNVAYHLQRLGARAVPVTAVGEDTLGHELVRRMRGWGLETDFVSIISTKPTGLVRVDLTASGAPSYEIVEDVAWDWIPVSDALSALAKNSAAIVFGSLAQRSENNQRALASLRQCGCFQVFDVNLRPPFDAPDLIWKLARGVDLIKLNDHELQTLLGCGTADSLEMGARELARKTSCPHVCITAGSKGAGLLSDDCWFWADARPIAVRDTIGAGDSFLASLVKGLLDSNFGAKQNVLENSCRLAEFVASRPGATPSYSITNEGTIRS